LTLQTSDTVSTPKGCRQSVSEHRTFYSTVSIS